MKKQKNGIYIKRPHSSVDEILPNCNEHRESDYLLCVDLDSNIPPFVAFYNNLSDEWIVSHHSSNGIYGRGVNVTNYKPLPTPPNK